MQQAGADPLEEYPGSSNRWRCRCHKCRREIHPRLYLVRNGGRPCKWCAGVVIDPVEARQFMLDSDLRPLVAYPGVAEPWPCECLRCGSLVSPRLDSVKNRGDKGCQSCAGNLPLSRDEAEQVMLRADIIPTGEWVNARTPWEGKCKKCGNPVKPRLDNIRSGQGGCSNCADYGFDRVAPSLVYLIYHPHLDAAKVGKANVGSGRVRGHVVAGWEVYRIIHVESGFMAEAIERGTLKTWRDRGWPALPLTDEVRRCLPRLGETETVALPSGGMTSLIRDLLAAEANASEDAARRLEQYLMRQALQGKDIRSAEIPGTTR